MSTETLDFGADVSKLLDIVANALYTNHDVFLRELISNAADACDKLRYEAIANPELTKDAPNFRIHVFKDTKARTLTLIDNGIGMSKKELTDNLGTIAKSGTQALMKKVNKGKEDKDLNLIGQFGVGFYASYMVADNVVVISRKAGSKQAHRWESDGRKGFTINKATKEEAELLDGERGTAIILNIKDDGCEFLIDEKIKQTIKQYSDHIDVKIFLGSPEETDSGEGKPINDASAIWRRSKNDVTEEQYTEFYKHISGGIDEPLLTAHWRAEGVIEFNALLYIPTMRPWDLYDAGRKPSVRLYVRRVMISDNLEGLTYPWLRFVRGVVDSEDLPLNISREGLQHNPIVAKIRTSLTKRILGDLDKLAKNDTDMFAAFWGNFGSALKEGLYDTPEHRSSIFKVCRFYSTHDNGEKLTSLADYVARMQEGQKEIYYISGENVDALKNSPQIEGFKSRGLEVLFFTDTVDDFWLQQIHDFEKHPFKSATKGDIDFSDVEEDKTEEKEDKTEASATNLIQSLKKLLQAEVDDVKISNRLTDSPVCLVAPSRGVDMHMEQVLKVNQNYTGDTKPILEINADHPLIKMLEKMAKEGAANDDMQDAGYLLLDQARIIQGQQLQDPAAFARRMSAFIEKGLS